MTGPTTLPKHRPFRFGVQAAIAPSARDWTELARRTEALGYDVLSMPDHIGGRFAWGPALTLAAAATTTLKVGTLVLDNDLRHPALTATEAATIDILSDGRLELGIGAGWMLEDYIPTGIPFDPPAVRVDRLEEGLAIIKGMLSGEAVTQSGKHFTVRDLQSRLDPVQKPHPPILIGAGGKRMLRLGLREADIIGLAPPALPEGGIDLDIGADAVERQVQYLREQDNGRLANIELQMLNQFLEITDDPMEAAERKGNEWNLPAATIADSPHVLIGSVESITETLIKRRERYGLSYVVVRPPVMELFAPVVARLAGK